MGSTSNKKTIFFVFEEVFFPRWDGRKKTHRQKNIVSLTQLAKTKKIRFSLTHF